MKIGILSLMLHTNYGGILQAYALQTVLERMGHEVTILDKDRTIHRSVFRQSLTLGKFILSKFLLKKDVVYYTPDKLNRERREREQFTQTFINKYIHRCLVRTIQTGVFNDVDAIVVGSDQVWRPLYFELHWKTGIEQAFLKFASSYQIKRIAYAPSFGCEEWEYSEKETKKCAQLLQLFNAVSVREKSALSLCSEKLCRDDVRHTLDPTMLLSKEDYIHLVKNAKTRKSPGNLLCYILDDSEDKQALIKRIAYERHLTPFHANSQINNPNAPQAKRIQPPIEQWLRGFMDAEFVVTDSFHACILSIVFDKPFVVIGNEKRGKARYESLFSMFSMEEHLITSIKDYRQECSYSIQSDVIKKLEKYKQESFSFLKESLR